MPIDPKFVNLIAQMVTDDPDVLKNVQSDDVQKTGSKTSSKNNGMISEGLTTHRCRNNVYRRGIVMKCNRACTSAICEGCTKALQEKRDRLLGLSEAKKEPSNKPDDLEVEDSFEVHDDYDEDKKEPGKPGKQKRKSSLQDGPEGEKGSKKSPYLEDKMKKANKEKAKKEKKKICGRCDFNPPLEWSKAEEHGLCDRCSMEL